jgi:hypothetical protein
MQNINRRDDERWRERKREREREREREARRKGARWRSGEGNREKVKREGWGRRDQKSTFGRELRKQ